MLTEIFQVTNVIKDYDASEEDDDEEEPSALRSTYGYEFGGSHRCRKSQPPRTLSRRFLLWPLRSVSVARSCLARTQQYFNYKMYLASGILGFVNIGHGNTNGIALYDGFLDAAWFNGIANQAVSPAVVYFNSCQVHNDPLKSAVMKPARRPLSAALSIC